MRSRQARHRRINRDTQEIYSCRRDARFCVSTKTDDTLGSCRLRAADTTGGRAMAGQDSASSSLESGDRRMRNDRFVIHAVNRQEGVPDGAEVGCGHGKP